MGEETSEAAGLQAPASALPVRADEPQATPQPLACTACKRPIDGSYYRLNGRPYCGRCRNAILDHFERPLSGAEWLNGTVLVLGAVLGSAAGWYFIREATGYEIGLIAIGVAIVIGKALRRAARGIGSLGLQISAVAFTYLAIAGSNAPKLFAVFLQHPPDAASPLASLPPPAAAAVQALGLALASPFFDVQANVLGLVIIAFALFQAWRLTAPVPLVWEGPLAYSEGEPLPHAQEVETLAASARELETAGDISGALAQWRKALDLLPPESQRRAEVQEKILALSRAVDDGTAGPPADGKVHQERRGAFAAIGAALLFLLTKAKILLLGLTKLSTLASMALFFGVYWKLYGWEFGAGLVASIYIHEMGHVAALRKFGIDASAPMFIPGLGALVRLKQYPSDPREDARVGLAGPLWGLGAALAALGAGTALSSAALLAIARTGAWINLFNLVPIWQLDGSRGLRALDRTQRIIVAAVVGGAWALTHEGLLLLVLLAVVYRLFEKNRPEEGDRRTLVEWVTLVAALSAINAIPTAGV